MKLNDKELQVGSKVFDQRYGIGIVQEVTAETPKMYPILVRYENTHESYTVDGRSLAGGPIYLIWPKMYRYLCKDSDWFITDSYFESKEHASRVMIGVEVIREIEETAREL